MMKRALVNLIIYLLSIAWMLTHLLAVVWAAEFLAEHFRKGEEET